MVLRGFNVMTHSAFTVKTSA